MICLNFTGVSSVGFNLFWRFISVFAFFLVPEFIFYFYVSAGILMITSSSSPKSSSFFVRRLWHRRLGSLFKNIQCVWDFLNSPNDGSWPPLVQGMVSFSVTFPPKVSAQTEDGFLWFLHLAAWYFVLHQSSKAEKGSAHLLSHLFWTANILSLRSQCQAISGFLSSLTNNSLLARWGSLSLARELCIPGKSASSGSLRDNFLVFSWESGSCSRLQIWLQRY